MPAWHMENKMSFRLRQARRRSECRQLASQGGMPIYSPSIVQCNLVDSAHSVGPLGSRSAHAMQCASAHNAVPQRKPPRAGWAAEVSALDERAGPRNTCRTTVLQLKSRRSPLWGGCAVPADAAEGHQVVCVQRLDVARQVLDPLLQPAI